MKAQKHKKIDGTMRNAKFAIEEMKKAREMWLIKGRRENEEQGYHHKRKKLTK